MRKNERPIGVFLSYPFEAMETAKRLHRALDKAGLKVFDPDRLKQGDEFLKQIRSGISDSDVVVFIAPPEGEFPPEMNFEYGAAWGAEKKTIVFGDKANREKFPGDLRNRVFATPDDAEGLAQRIKELTA